MKSFCITISSLLMNTSSILMDMLWLTLALLNPVKASVGMVLLVMGVTRVIFYLLINKSFTRLNFYGNYVIGLAAAFIIILVATKSPDNYWLYLMIVLSQLFATFKSAGDNNVFKENLIKNNQIIIFKIVKWLAFPLAALVLMFYSSILEYIYAALAVITGLSMIFLYQGFSKEYAKKLVTEKPVELSDVLNEWQNLSIRAVLILVVYGLIFSSINNILVIVCVSLVSVVVDVFVIKSDKTDSSLFEGVGLVVLSIIKFII